MRIQISREKTYLSHLNLLLDSSEVDWVDNNSLPMVLESETFNEILIEERVTNNLKKVIFEVTQNCNLRCKYCIFGGKYKYYRSHSSKVMPFEIIKDTISYIKVIRKDSSNTKLTISFYGGEPFLNFDTVKKGINFIKSSFYDRYNFFSDNPLVCNNHIKVNAISRTNLINDSYNKITDSYVEEYYQLLSKIIIKAKKGCKLNNFENSIYLSIKSIYDELNSSKTLMGGSCLMDTSLYVDTHGEFHACESMNGSFSIGNIKGGYDFKRMVEIVESYKEVRRVNCTNCDIRFLCNACFVYLQSYSNFVVQRKYCDDLKKHAFRILKIFSECDT